MKAIANKIWQPIFSNSLFSDCLFCWIINPQLNQIVTKVIKLPNEVDNPELKNKDIAQAEDTVIGSAIREG